MSKQVKWSGTTKKFEQAQMWSRTSPGTDPEEKVFVLVVVKKVTLLKRRVIQLEVGSSVSVANIVIMLAIAKGEGTRSLENKTTPNNREAENSVVVKEDRPMSLRVVGSQVKMHPRKPRASTGRETGRNLGARKMKKRRGEGRGREKRKGKPWASSLQKVFLDHLLFSAVIGLIFNLI